MTTLDRADLPWIGDVIDVITAAAGQPWRVALDRLDRVAAPANRLAAVIGAVRWWLGGRARNAPLARRARELVLGVPALDASARAARVASAAATLGIASPELERALWSDLPRERPIELPRGRPDELDIIATANLQLVQRALRRALEVRIRVWGDAGLLLRAASHRGLLATATLGTDGDTALDIVGPLALVHRTAVYGRALGHLVPLLGECERFELEMHGDRYTSRLVSPLRLPAAPASLGSSGKLAATLARDLERAGCNVTPTPPPIVAGGSIAWPELVVERAGSCWYVELLGFWTAPYLARKLATYRAAGIAEVVFCVDDARSCADDEPPPGCHVVRYKRRIPAAEILGRIKVG